MKRVPYLLLFLLLASVLACREPAYAAGSAVQFGTKLSLHSKILNQDRTYWIYLPPSYQTAAHQKPQKYPALFVLDGDWNFQWSSDVVQYLADNRQIPELIVVAVGNIDREKDFTPTHGHDTNYPTSGGGPEFERFMDEELAPAIDAKYRTVPCRILMGHSLGGALVFDSFLRQTNGFHAIIAIDPSLWWDDQVLVHRAAEFTLNTNSQISLFIANATAPPSANRTNIMLAPAQRVVSLLQSNAPPGLRVGYQLLEGEDHLSCRLLGLYRGLQFIFDGYKPIGFAGLDTPDSIANHYDQLSIRLGYQILPPAHFVDDVGHALLDAHETDQAIECFKLNLTNYPATPYVYVHLADAYSAKGDKASAIQNYQKALALDPTRDDPKPA